MCNQRDIRGVWHLVTEEPLKQTSESPEFWWSSDLEEKGLCRCFQFFKYVQVLTGFIKILLMVELPYSSHLWQSHSMPPSITWILHLGTILYNDYKPSSHFVHCVPDCGVFQYRSKVSWQSRLESQNLNEWSFETQEVSLQMQESRFEFRETHVFLNIHHLKGFRENNYVFLE